MERTIVSTLSQPVPAEDADWVARRAVTLEMMETRFTTGWQERDAAIAAYERHNEEVRAAVPPGRLVDWRAADGWQPLCAALDLPVPAVPFPRTNTTADFRSEQGLEGEGP
jgi:hypothetical protein